MQTFSALSLIRRAFGGHAGWQAHWRTPEPKAAYDAIIVGGGGHGLGTAYYLAKEHGLRNIAVLERGWLGGGNTGRNTTIIRSNYLFDESAALYDHALKLWEGLSSALNYNVMYSPRGVMMLAHTHHDVQVSKRHVHANRANGVDNEWLTAEQAKAFCPPLNISPGLRYPVLGAALQRRGGTARHDAVAWGYARAADALGVDIIQNCEVTGILRGRDGAVEAVETTRGRIRAPKVGVAAAGHTSVVMAMAGMRLPLESFPLQALVSEPVKPVFPCVVMSNTVHAYISQSDKGELVIGAGTDAYVSYSQRGGLHIPAHTLDAICELFPMFRRMRMLRNWGGIVDTTPDRSPIIAKTPVPGLYVNCGWGTGGLQGDARLRSRLRLDDGTRRAAPDQRAVHAGTLPRRPDDRRGGGRGRGALRNFMLLIDCPYCGNRPELEFAYGGEAHIARPNDPAALSDDEWATFLYLRSEPEGRACRTLAARARLRAVLQRGARHGQRLLRCNLQGRRAAAGSRPAQGGRVNAPFRTACRRPHRPRAGAALHLRRPQLLRGAGRYAGVGAARQWRASRGTLVQVPSAARDLRRRRGRAERARHRRARCGALHAEPAGDAGGTASGAARGKPEPLAVAALRSRQSSATRWRRCCRRGSTTRRSNGRQARGSACMNRRSARRRGWAAPRPCPIPTAMSAAMRIATCWWSAPARPALPPRWRRLRPGRA